MLDKPIIDICELYLNRKPVLEEKLSRQEIINNPEEYKSLIKEYNTVSEIVSTYKNIKELQEKISVLEKEKINENSEYQLLIEEEIEILKKEIKKLESTLYLLLLPQDENTNKNIILEIRAGTGGEEAALFAGDLLRMYLKFATKKSWTTEILSINETGLKGVKEVVCYISGKDVYKYLKYESGVHRVQRVPITEASGRIHTSTSTVAVLPEADEIDVKIDPKDIVIETFRASGHGGQHLQKTDSAVRIKHLPTGIIVQCQDERSQIKNRERAMKILRARLYDMFQQQQKASIDKLRREQVKSGERSEKIRTYNFPQNRVTDHRINFSLYTLDKVLDGDLDELIEKLIYAELQHKIKNLIV